MTVPYIVVDADNTVRCLCKGCGEVLWTAKDGRTTKSPAYGDLYLAMSDDEGVLSQHSTPACPGCAERLKDANVVELQPWFDADILHWFVEERTAGRDPNTAYRRAQRCAGGRHPVRVLRYVPGGA